jgi:uncharacterized protein (TIGR02391 family)
MATSVPPFDDATIERIARIMGDTGSGFTGTEIARLLQVAQIRDPGETTKWRRIAQALSDQQTATRSGNHVIVFIKVAMKPVRWSHDREGFNRMREDLNTVLAFNGLTLLNDGRVAHRQVARTHDEAAVAKRLRDEMVRRGGHGEIFKYCTQELIEEDCFGAVFETCKGLADRIRGMCGLDKDGHQLFEAAFEGSSPMIAFNSLRTSTELNEQRGLSNLAKGMFSAFRNPEAHEPKLRWHISEPDALDLLSIASLIHRRLDAAVVVRRKMV